jgi:lysine-ketoglutarate reductase/saccharopine dehydrogenase-like protein (TIGR00300 family)
MFEEVVELRGPLLQLPTVSDVVKCLIRRGLDFEVDGFELAKTPQAPSWLRLRIKAKTQTELSGCLDEITRLGARLADADDARTDRVEADGLLPEGFYVLTGLPTEVRVNGQWLPVAAPMPTAAIRVDQGRMKALGVPMERAKKGDRIVVGRVGVRVAPQAPDPEGELYALVGSTLSIGQARGPVVLKIAREIERAHRRGEKVLLVGGSAVVHSGAGSYLEQLLHDRHVDVLLMTNAMAVCDLESALFGTARGVYVSENLPAAYGAENTLHALNAIRQAGGLRQAVQSQALTSGILHTCVTANVPFVIVGSVRDEAALPDTITDSVRAREALRDGLEGVGLALMVAAGDLAKAVLMALPGTVQKVCVDASEYDVSKIVTRGAPSVFGLVESAECFLRELARNLGAR